VTSVRFLAADGSRLGTATVLDPPWTVEKVKSSPDVTSTIPAITAMAGEPPQF
jgi:hypothetical protein